MIFPKDINKRIADKHRIAGDNLMQLISTVFIVGNFVLFFVCRWISGMVFERSFLASTLLQIGINAFVGTLIFRFVIIDENSLIKEYKNADNDSFARFVHVRKNVSKVIKVHDKEVSVIEFDDGSVSSTIEFKFGSNDTLKANSTEKVFQQIYKTGMLYGFEIRTVVLPEDFTLSDEFSTYEASINRIESKKLKHAMSISSGAVLNYSKANSNVNVIYLTIRSLNSSSRADIETVLSKIFTIVFDSYTAFRSVRFLNMKTLIEFYRLFYDIPAIDLQMMKTFESSEGLNNSYTKIVNVYGLVDENNKFYSSKESRNLFNEERL